MNGHARAYTGHQTSVVDMTRAERLAFGQAHAPEKVDPPQHRCARCGEKTTLLRTTQYAKGRVCLDCWAELEWQSVLALVGERPTPKRVTKDAIGYDPTCGMKPAEIWASEFLWETFDDWKENGFPEEPMPPEIVAILFPKRRHCPARLETPKKIDPPKVKPTINPQDKPKKKPLSLGHQKILDQIGGNTEVPCPGCGLDLSPRYKLAAEQGSCPAVFVYAKDHLAYCGPCYGKLPYYPDPALSKPVGAPAKG